MSGCKPEEGIFPPDGNKLTLEQDAMQIVAACKPNENRQCSASFEFIVDGTIVVSHLEPTLSGQPCTKHDLEHAWNPFLREFLVWASTQNHEVYREAHHFMSVAMSEFSRLGIPVRI